MMREIISFYLRPLSKKKTRILTIITILLIFLVGITIFINFVWIDSLSISDSQKLKIIGLVSDFRNLVLLVLLLGLLLRYLPFYLDAPTKLRLIENLISIKSYDKAEKIVDELISLFPQDWKFHNIMARIKIEQGDLKSSWSWLTLAELWAKKEKEEINNNKSLICYLNKAYDISFEINEKILKKNRKNIIAILRKLEILRVRKNWQDLITFFEQSKKILESKNELYLDAFLCFYEALKANKMSNQLLSYLTDLKFSENLPTNTLYNYGVIFYKEKKKEKLNSIFLKICVRCKQDLDEKANNQIDLWKSWLNSP